MRNSAIIELIGYVYGEPKYPMPDKYPNWISFSMSVTERYRDKNKEEQKKVEWFKCNSWSEGLSQIINKHIKKGSGVMVRGKPKTPKAYTDKEGNIQSGNIEVNISDINILTYPQEDDNRTTYATSTLNKGAEPPNSNGRYAIPKSEQKHLNSTDRDIVNDEIPW